MSGKTNPEVVLPPENTTFIPDGEGDFYVATTVSARHSVAHVAAQFAAAYESAMQHAKMLGGAADAGSPQAAALAAFIGANLGALAERKANRDKLAEFRAVAGTAPEVA